MSNSFSLGPRLRALRKERALTQKELAGQAGISVNAVSLIERGQISPSVSTLQRLASALNVRMSYFFDEDVRTQVVHLKAGERPSMESKGIRIESLGQRLQGQGLEPFFVCLAPGSESGKKHVVHLGHEFVYCLRGQVEYNIDGDTYLLREGDILLFEAQLPHHWRNPTHEEAELMLILQACDGSEESVRGHFPSYPSLTYVE